MAYDDVLNVEEASSLFVPISIAPERGQEPRLQKSRNAAGSRVYKRS